MPDMPDPVASVEAARVLIAGAFADFIIFLSAMQDPIIVGGTYPRTKFIDAFNQWCKMRNFDSDDANVSSWREACNNNFFKKRGYK